MTFRRNNHIIALGVFLTLLTLAHVLIFKQLSPRVVLEELYYIPIFFWRASFRSEGRPFNLPVCVEMGRFQMQMALGNLINNAIEASGNGQGVAVSVIPGKNSLWIAIKDNGAGMDSETAENIFTPFYTRKSGGTGLGMSITKKIIDSHHGRINVSSKTGKGTAVTIELPYKEAAKRGFGS